MSSSSDTLTVGRWYLIWIRMSYSIICTYHTVSWILGRWRRRQCRSRSTRRNGDDGTFQNTGHDSSLLLESFSFSLEDGGHTEDEHKCGITYALFRDLLAPTALAPTGCCISIPVPWHMSVWYEPLEYSDDNNWRIIMVTSRLKWNTIHHGSTIQCKRCPYIKFRSGEFTAMAH